MNKICVLALAALLVLSTDVCAAAPPGTVRFSGPIHSASSAFPARLAAFASCTGRPRIFGTVEAQRYVVELPTGIGCTVFVGEYDWDALPIPVQDAAVAVPLPVLVYARAIPEPALAAELIAMGKEDQSLRGDHWRPDDPDVMRRLEAGDALRQQRLAAIIAVKGWPTLSMVGWEAANAAWLVAQHAPPAQLNAWLVLMRQAGARHEIAPYNLATSIDRALVYDGKEQIYGTQFQAASGPYPSIDPARLDERRLGVGLPVVH